MFHIKILLKFRELAQIPLLFTQPLSRITKFLQGKTTATSCSKSRDKRLISFLGVCSGVCSRGSNSGPHTGKANALLWSHNSGLVLGRARPGSSGAGTDHNAEDQAWLPCMQKSVLALWALSVTYINIIRCPKSAKRQGQIKYWNFPELIVTGSKIGECLNFGSGSGGECWRLNPGWPHARQTPYQLYYHLFFLFSSSSLWLSRYYC